MPTFYVSQLNQSKVNTLRVEYDGAVTAQTSVYDDAVKEGTISSVSNILGVPPPK